MLKHQFSTRSLLVLPLLVPIAIGIGRWMLPVERPKITYWHEYKDIPALKVVDVATGEQVHRFGYPYEPKSWQLRPGTYRVETIEKQSSREEHPGLQFMYTNTGPRIRVTELSTDRDYTLWGDESITAYKVRPGTYRLDIPNNDDPDPSQQIIATESATD